MSEDEIVSLLQKIGEDISMMKTLLRLQAMESISTMLRKIASTSERQQMWRLADSNRSNEEIAGMIGVSLRSVQYFIQEAQDAGLIIMKRRGYPSRIVDVFPSAWKPWKPKSVEAGQEKVDQEPAVKEGEPNVQA